MKLVYSKNRCNQADAIHRFDVLGDLLPSDLGVLQNSLTLFFEQLKKSNAPLPIVVLDISDAAIKTNEHKLQSFIYEIRNHALASQIFMGIAQTDIESMHVEQKAVEQSLMNQIHLLETKLGLVESIKEKIQAVENENEALRNQISESKPTSAARTVFEKLWG